MVALYNYIMLKSDLCVSLQMPRQSKQSKAAKRRCAERGLTAVDLGSAAEVALHRKIKVAEFALTRKSQVADVALPRKNKVAEMALPRKKQVASKTLPVTFSTTPNETLPKLCQNSAK